MAAYSGSAYPALKKRAVRTPTYSAVAQAFGAPKQRAVYTPIRSQMAQAFAAPKAAPAGQAPPQPAPARQVGGKPGGGKGIDRVLTGDLYNQLSAALGGLGYQQYNDDNPLGPQGYWAKIGRGGEDFLNFQGAWADPRQFELVPEYGGLTLGDWDKSTDDRGEWDAFLGMYGARLAPSLLAALKGWLG